MHETRPEVVFAETRRMLNETGKSLESFALEVVEQYRRLTPSTHQAMDFKTDGDTYRQAATNAQRLRRYMDETQPNSRMPLELEEAWIEALPSPYRERVIHQLTHRFGYLAVAMPDPDKCTVAGIAAVLTEHAEAVQASAPMVADGQLDEADRPYARHSYQEHMEAAAAHISAAFGIAQRFPEETGDADGVVPFPDGKTG